MKYLFLLLFSLPSFACMNRISPVDAKKVIEAQSYQVAESLTYQGTDFVCIDGKDLLVHDFINGQLVYNSDKAFARQLALEKAEVTRLQALAEKKAAEEFIEAFEPKGNSIAALKAEVKQLADAIKKTRK